MGIAEGKLYFFIKSLFSIEKTFNPCNTEKNVDYFCKIALLDIQRID